MANVGARQPFLCVGMFLFSTSSNALVLMDGAIPLNAGILCFRVETRREPSTHCLHSHTLLSSVITSQVPWPFSCKFTPQSGLGEVCIQSLLEDEFQLHFHTPDVRMTCGPASTDSSYVPWLLGKICCGVAWHGKREACDSCSVACCVNEFCRQ